MNKPAKYRTWERKKSSIFDAYLDEMSRYPDMPHEELCGVYKKIEDLEGKIADNLRGIEFFFRDVIKPIAYDRTFNEVFKANNEDFNLRTISEIGIRLENGNRNSEEYKGLVKKAVNCSIRYNIYKIPDKVIENIKSLIKNLSHEIPNDDKEKANILKKHKNILQNVRRNLSKIDSYKKDIVNSYLRSVVGLAKKYYDRGVPALDTIQEGNIGLIKAVDRFKYKRGYKFSTYAEWWIRQTINKYIKDKSRNVRLPFHVLEDIYDLDEASKYLRKELLREETIEELAEYAEMSVEKAHKSLIASKQEVSLNEPMNGEDSSLWIDLMGDESVSVSEGLVNEISLAEQTRKVLATLTPREEEVLRMRFGIGYDDEHTLEEIGQDFTLTRERIRQIEAKALRKLRHPTRTEFLEAFVDDIRSR